MDPYGFTLTCASTTGDDWSISHDGFLETVVQDLRDMGMKAQTEIAGIFRGVIPDPASQRRFDALPWKKRRGMVPDLRVQMCDPEGQAHEYFGELKFIHFGPTRYAPAHIRHAARCRSVQVRAGAVHAEYVKKARSLDATFCGSVRNGPPGPVERRLALLGEVRPIVIGAFAEASPFLEELVSAAADVGASKHWRRMRCNSTNHARGLLLQVLRRSWGFAAFRANAQLVLRRLQHVGGAGGGANPHPTARCRRRMWRRRDFAGEHYGWGRGVH
jgi:hypothetical protein